MARKRDPSPSSPVPDAKPTVGITMGDPTGIGPEVILKALLDPQLRVSARFVIYGLNEILTYTADRLEVDPCWVRVQHDSHRADAPHQR